MNRFETSTLRAYYGNLLTDRQNEILRLHFDEDISYGELADMFSISRQAAYDAVKKGSELLAKYEDKLRLVEREHNIGEIIDKISQNANIGECKAIIALANDIKRILEE